MPWEIYEVKYENEDGSKSYTWAFFDNIDAAKEAAKGKGCMGASDGAIVEHPIYSSLADHNANNPEARKKKALAKLTKEEIKLLGLGR